MTTKACVQRFLSSSTRPFGEREKLAQNYLSHREWTVEKFLANRKALKEHTGFAKQSQVNWIGRKDTVEKAVVEMVNRKLGSILVCDDVLAERKQFLGILTERDYLSKLLVRGLSSKTTNCEDIMTQRKHLSVVSLDSTIYECLQAFEQGSFRHLPVVATREDLGPNQEDVLGVFSQRDLIHEFKRFHFANLEYLEALIDFPVW